MLTAVAQVPRYKLSPTPEHDEPSCKMDVTCDDTLTNHTQAFQTSKSLNFIHTFLFLIHMKTSIDSLQSRAEVLVEVVFGIYDLSKDETFNK